MVISGINTQPNRAVVVLDFTLTTEMEAVFPNGCAPRNPMPDKCTTIARTCGAHALAPLAPNDGAVLDAKSMTPLVLSVLPFAIAMLATPGPNNVMLASAGGRFGFVETLPLQAGMLLGMGAMTLAAGFGIAELITAAPKIVLVMKIACLGYMLWLALQIATAESVKDARADLKPLGLFQAALFQLVNPKAWVIALTAVTTYTTATGSLRMQVVLITLVFAAVGVVTSSAWVLLGRVIRRYLTTTRIRNVFNWAMASLLVLSMVPVLIGRI